MGGPYYKRHWVEIDPERHAAYDAVLGFHPAMEPLIRPLELRSGMRVLDVGSGPGHTARELARRAGPNGRVTGVDINAEFVRRAQREARAEKLALEFVQAAFPPLPFLAGAFDRVFCKNVLEYVDSPEATVAEMARVAARGGVVGAVDSDWEMMALEIGAGARERSERILAAARRIAVHTPRIGRRLYGLFRGAGLGDIRAEVISGADTQGRSLPMLTASLARYARDAGESPAEVAAWLEDIAGAIERAEFLFVLPQFVVRGTKG